MGQTFNLTDRIDPNLIDLGTLNYNISGYLGGSDTENDAASIIVTFMNVTKQILYYDTVGPTLAADRENITSLIYQETLGTVPIGTRIINLLVAMSRTDGTSNNAAIDDVSLVLYP